MLAWCFVLFVLGILAFLDSQFNYGYLFRTTNSLMFLLVSLGILVRTRILQKWGFREQLIINNDELRDQLVALRKSKASEEKGNHEKAVPSKTT
jgi:hypothetical protein